MSKMMAVISAGKKKSEDIAVLETIAMKSIKIIS